MYISSLVEDMPSYISFTKGSLIFHSFCTYLILMVFCCTASLKYSELAFKSINSTIYDNKYPFR